MTNSEKSPSTRSRGDTHGNRDRGGNNSDRKRQGVVEGAGKTTRRMKYMGNTSRHHRKTR